MSDVLLDSCVIAIDIGGTKLAVAVVDDDGAVGSRNQVPTPRGDADDVWAAVAGLVTEAGDHLTGRCAGVGVCSAGPIDLANATVSPINIAGWHGFPLCDRLGELSGLPVTLLGDGTAMATGERWKGAARGHDDVLGVVVSSGVGGGLVLDGTPRHGPSGNAGHVGHIAVADSHECACGRRGCVEAIASGPSMLRWAHEHGCEASDAARLAALARSGDRVAAAAFGRAGEALGAMLADVAVTCDLTIVVIGGGVANAGALLFDPLRTSFAANCTMPFARATPIVRAELGDDAGLIGAAAHVFDTAP